MLQYSDAGNFRMKMGSDISELKCLALKFQNHFRMIRNSGAKNAQIFQIRMKMRSEISEVYILE